MIFIVQFFKKLSFEKGDKTNFFGQKRKNLIEYKADLEVRKMIHIDKIRKILNVDEEYFIPYGKYKGKIDYRFYNKIKNNPDGKLILVTALTPTKTGEGKTTVSIGLADGLRALNKTSVLCLREPSLGPVFGLKGGATGGGKISVLPVDDINLHFNGDMHALTSSINLISAVIDNHIFQGNALRIDENRILWQRALDMNDRALRDVMINNNPKYGNIRSEQFMITVASELMAILCLAKDPKDFLQRINKISVAYNQDGEIVFLQDLKISHAIMKLMREAFSPNLVQTTAGNPAIIHGGPFANIAHGCNSIIANQMALKLGDYVVTEAGFGADLGAEKFFDIHIPALGKNPDGCVFVATIKAMKSHGGVAYEKLNEENVEKMLEGAENVRQHLENIKKYGVPAVIALNKFNNDHENELTAFKKWCSDNNFKVHLIDGFDRGVDGCTELAQGVLEMLETQRSRFKTIYKKEASLKEKIETVAREIYRADGVVYKDGVLEKLAEFEKLGFGQFPICIAKTPLSFSDNPTILNAPRNYKITVSDVNLKTGAQFVVAMCGDILTMPGLPILPNAVKMEDEPLDWIE